MATSIPPPDHRELLPPLLACLPLAFISPRPPPALPPLLSPILRQRVQYSASDAGGSEGWLPLLSWDHNRASKLSSVVEGLQIEPHPVSGELEFEDVETLFRRPDEETLHAGIRVEQYGLMPIYVWCETDTQGGSAGWKLAELRSLEDSEDGAPWHKSLAEANSASLPRANGTHASTSTANEPNNDDDDDAYWGAYDQTPAQIPGPPKSPASQPRARMVSTQSTEDAYYAQYGQVQPALDAHDPDEAAVADSTLNGTALPVSRSLFPSDAPPVPQPAAPRPISPASTGSSVARLERGARTEADMQRAEDGVRDFIAREVRNLFRLARSAGIEREDFEGCVRRELDVVGLLEDEI